VPGGIYDRRPCEVDGFVQGRTSGFYIDGAGSVSIRNSSVLWGVNRPDYFAHAIESSNTRVINITGFAGEAANPEKYPAVKK